MIEIRELVIKTEVVQKSDSDKVTEKTLNQMRKQIMEECRKMLKERKNQQRIR